MTFRTKLRRPKELAAFEDGLRLSGAESFEQLFRADNFFDLLGAGWWWETSLPDKGMDGARVVLEDMARIGIRCVLISARVGIAGYFSILAHPSDIESFPSREISRASGSGRRVACGHADYLFTRMKMSDLSAAPKIFGDNEDRARSASRARLERHALRAEIGQTAEERGGSKRL